MLFFRTAYFLFSFFFLLIADGTCLDAVVAAALTRQESGVDLKLLTSALVPREALIEVVHVDV